MSATTEDQTEEQGGPPEATEWPEEWPVATRYGDRTVFSEDLRQDLRVGGVVRAVEVLADVQEAVRDHLKLAFDNLEHEGVEHTVGNAIDLAHESATILRRAAVLYWMERKGQVVVSGWPMTRIDYGGSSDASENGDGSESAARIDNEDLQALGVLLHAAALASDGELANGNDRTPEEARQIWSRLLDDVKPVYKRLLAARGITYSAAGPERHEDDTAHGLAVVNEARDELAAEIEGDDSGEGES